MITYTVEQKVALIKMFDLFRLDKNLPLSRAAKLIGCKVEIIKAWNRFDSLPSPRFCYQIEKVLVGFTPTLHADVLDATNLNTDIVIAKRNIQTRQDAYKNREKPTK